MSENRLKVVVGAAFVMWAVALGGAIVSDRKEHAGLAQVVPITAAPYFPEGRRPRCFRYNDHWRCSDGRTTMDCTENLCWPLCGVSR